MTRNILSVGLELASDSVEETEFSSKTSLLDWDIILFRPTIEQFISIYTNKYKGKPSLNDTDSFRFREACEHWRREIKQAFKTGKTIIVFLSPPQECYIDTGQREYSGTGRNRQTTQIVDLYTNYNALPMLLEVVAANGTAMKLTPVGAQFLAPYWEQFGSASSYKLLLPQDTQGVCLFTKHGDKPVGAILRDKDSSGSLILLPDIDFLPDDFLESDGSTWSSDARQFAARMTCAVVALDKVLRASDETTPEPAWATDEVFALSCEAVLRTELLEAERRVEEAQKKKEDIQERLKDAGRLRALLFEKGKSLEKAIIKSLELLGFSAAPYKSGDSEFDVVFQCPEGRLLGEAEGKDSKPINVDKLRQLAMNIHEDLQREEVSTPAKGALFGNGFRLTAPSGRELQFTEKCINASKTSSTALIATSELYVAVQYLLDHADEEFAQRCRELMLSGVGLVAFPPPPSVEATDSDVANEPK